MTYERETIVERTPVERETVVTTGSSPIGMIVGIIVALLLIVAAIMFFNGAFNGGSRTIDVDVPAVTVTPDGQ